MLSPIQLGNALLFGFMGWWCFDWQAGVFFLAVSCVVSLMPEIGKELSAFFRGSRTR
jgi:hypothetical protein